MEEEIDLSGVIDLHVHSAPDDRPRLLDDFGVAHAAGGAGMRAILLKNHSTLTADRAALVAPHVPGLAVLGGLVLNAQVGGINPAAVEFALALGAREVWLPTLSAANHRHYEGRKGGIKILNEQGEASEAVLEVLALLAEKDVILGTGHIAFSEIAAVIPAARRAGMKRILVTHPEFPPVNLSIQQQLALAGPGIWFERCYASTTSIGGGVPMARITADIRALGVETTILSTDLGQAVNPAPVQGFRLYLAALAEAGFTSAELDRMARHNPTEVSGL
ncbi:MAG: DUF6282 family protein [Anaerolineales bacterium]|jgi:hypothetical protein